MDSSNKSLIAVAVIAAFAIPLFVVLYLWSAGGDPIDLMIQAIFLFSLVPVIVMSAYMWATGRGAMLLAGYNTSPKAVRDLYDSKALTRFIGMSMTVSMILMLIALESIFLFDGMLPFWVLFIVSLVVLFAGLIYANTGSRFLKEGVTPQDVKGTAAEEIRKNKGRNTKITILSIVSVAVVLIGVFFFIGSGSVNATLTDDILKVEAPMVGESIQVDDISNVEWRDSFDNGRRVGGFGGTDISSGNFQNDEFGRYTLASYNSVPGHIVVHYSGGVLVFNLDSEEKTVQMFNDLQERLAELSD